MNRETVYANTLAGSGPQSFFESDGAVTVGRIFYRLFAGGRYTYALRYTNRVWGTFADGSRSRADDLCGRWHIHGLRIGVTESCTPTGFTEPARWQPLTFDGCPEKEAEPGEDFFTDGVELEAPAGAYLCVELTFSGQLLPHHPESMVPAFVREGTDWVPDTRQPFPSMVGCDRPVLRRIAFFGDSITQGIGVGCNAYTFWAAQLAEKLGSGYGFWNIGLGFGRASDGALNGCWTAMAKEAQDVFLCFGVNDLYWGRTAAQVKADIAAAVEALHRARCRVLVQAPPPGDYDQATAQEWQEVRRFVMEDLAGEAEAVFDPTPCLWLDEQHPAASAIGTVHPDEEGCRRWAEALYPTARAFLEARG